MSTPPCAPSGEPSRLSAGFDDSSVEELIEALTAEAMVDGALNDVEAGRTISHEEVGRRLESWYTPRR